MCRNTICEVYTSIAEPGECRKPSKTLACGGRYDDLISKCRPGLNVCLFVLCSKKYFSVCLFSRDR